MYIGSTQGGTRSCMANSGTSQRHTPTEDKSSIRGRGNPHGEIHGRQNGTQRGVQHRSATTIIRNAPVHPDVPLPHALPGARSGGFQRRPEEERYPAGVPFHTTWTPAGTLPRGDDGRFFGSCVEACEHINASPLPRLWMCEWGECAARPLGSGRRNLRTLQRANAKAGESEEEEVAHRQRTSSVSSQQYSISSEESFQ